MCALKEIWMKDKLRGSLVISWLLTVFTSFFGPALLPITIPYVGTMYAFRLLLPITMLLYLIWAVKEKKSWLRDIATIEKWCYLFTVILLVYGVVSLVRAIDFIFTFRKLFNLCFDLCFFVLLLRICREKDIRKLTLWLCGIMLVILCLLGIYEVFFNHILKPMEYKDARFFWLDFDRVFYTPVCFSGNTNNYATELVFLFSITMLAVLNSERKDSAKLEYCLFLTGAAVYFLLLAADAQLCEVAFKILLIGLILWGILRGKRFVRLPVLLLCCTVSITFAHQYRFIVPPIQQYMEQMSEYQQEAGSDQTIDEGATRPEKPTLEIGNPQSESLKDQFISVDEETGELALREDGTGGVRAHLLLHAFNCFKESYGLGVGLGNTEILARDRQVTSNGIWNIHCFIARIIADFGIFALIPLIVIGWLLLWAGLRFCFEAVRQKNRARMAYSILYFCALLVYPFASTAPSDAQDILTMWIYMAGIVIISINLNNLKRGCKGIV